MTEQPDHFPFPLPGLLRLCRRPGTYDENLEIDKPVTLQGRTAARGGNPAVVDGQISVSTSAKGAKLRRLRIAESPPFPGGTFPTRSPSA